MAFAGAYKSSQCRLAYLSGEAMATNYVAVKLASADGTVDLNDTAGEALVGIIQSVASAAGERVPVALSGVSMAVAGGAISKGAFLQGGGSGPLTTAASGDHIIAKALEAADASGDIISVLIVHGVVDAV